MVDPPIDPTSDGDEGGEGAVVLGWGEDLEAQAATPIVALATLATLALAPPPMADAVDIPLTVPEIIVPAEVILDPSDQTPLVTPGDAARLLGISLRTIYHWMSRGRVRLRYAAGGRALVELASLVSASKPAHARLGRLTGPRAGSRAARSPRPAGGPVRRRATAEPDRQPAA